MVDRLVRIVDGEVVALRDHGREALVYELLRASARLGLDGRLDVYRVGRDGSVGRLETGIWRGELEEWIEEYRDELDWVNHGWR